MKMYFWNYLTKPVGNNAISNNERKRLGSNLRLYVPNILDLWKLSLEKINDNLEIWNKIVFEVVENQKLKSFLWLSIYITGFIGNSRIFIFDNHNVAFYFIWKNYFKTGRKLDLIHVDQHSDMYVPGFIPDFLYENDIEKYTFEWTNVGNYLIPLQKLWFIWNIFQKRTEVSVLELDESLIDKCILNIDLDFWDPQMWTTTNSLLKIKKSIWKAPIILLATSPYFLDQKLAINLIKQILF